DIYVVLSSLHLDIYVVLSSLHLGHCEMIFGFLIDFLFHICDIFRPSFIVTY
ncbi:unnamed protein product, partial [Musa textilis]